MSTMKSSMSRLQQQDPEFYEFLKKEDKELLDFDASDDGSDDDGDSDDDGMHKLPAKLAVCCHEFRNCSTFWSVCNAMQQCRINYFERKHPSLTHVDILF